MTSNIVFRVPAKGHAQTDNPQVNPKKLPWFLRPFVGIINRAVHAPPPEVQVETIIVDTEKVDEAILKMSDYLLRNDWNPKQVLVGHSHYRGLLDHVQCICDYRPNIRPEIYGLELILVPWMEGVLVMPDLKGGY